MVIVAGVVARPGPVLVTGLLAKGTGCATAARLSVVAAVTAVVVSAGATGGWTEMGDGRGVVWAVLSDCRNVGGSGTKCWEGAWFGAWTEAWGTSEICWGPLSCMKEGVCVELTVTVAGTGVETCEEEFSLWWHEASMTATLWEDEEVGLTEKEMIGEASVTPGWVEVSRLKVSERLSEEKSQSSIRRWKNQYNQRR